MIIGFALIHLVLFLCKTIIVVAAILLILIGMLAITQRGKQKLKEGILQIKPLNQHYQELTLTALARMDKKAFKALSKELKQVRKQKPAKKIFIIDFKGDMGATQVASLREEITAILLIATVEDEVLLRLESPGGVVHGYGLAASELKRLKALGIRLTIAVDKVAASGGYMMAAVADEVIAAPFAIIGSIGVVMQLPNFHRFLEKRDIDFELLTAGQYKRTLTLFGENTDEGRHKAKEQLEKTHTLFKGFLQEVRPQINTDEVATGEFWFGEEAFKLKLVDRIMTSDEYLMQAYQSKIALYQLTFTQKKALSQRFGGFLQRLEHRLLFKGA